MFITDIFKRALLRRDIVHNHNSLVKELHNEIQEMETETIRSYDYLAIKFRKELPFREISLIYAAIRAGTNKEPGSVYPLLRSIVQRPDDMYFIAKTYTRIFRETKPSQIRLTKSMRKAFCDILERSVLSKFVSEVSGGFTLNQLTRWQGNGDLKKIIKLSGLEIVRDRNKVPRFRHSVIAAFMENEPAVPLNKAPKPATMHDAWKITAGKPARLFTPYDMLPLHYSDKSDPLYNGFVILEAAALTVRNIKDIPIGGDCTIILHYPNGLVTPERKISSLTAQLLSIKLQKPYYLVGDNVTVKVERTLRPFENPKGSTSKLPAYSDTVILISKHQIDIPASKRVFHLNPWASEGVSLEGNKTQMSLRDERTLEAMSSLLTLGPPVSYL